MWQKREICGSFNIRDLGEARRFIGLDISRDRDEKLLWVNQQHHAEQLLQRHGMEECKSHSTPLQPGI